MSGKTYALHAAGHASLPEIDSSISHMPYNQILQMHVHICMYTCVYTYDHDGRGELRQNRCGMFNVATCNRLDSH